MKESKELKDKKIDIKNESQGSDKIAESNKQTTPSEQDTGQTETNTTQATTDYNAEFYLPKNKIKAFLLILGLFFKMGLFTFGGGYAMIPLLENEFVSKRKWLSQNDFMNILVLSESTPGPIAINFATYIGYKVKKLWGSIVATIGVVLPSLIIIFILSLFFDNLLEYKVVQSAFRGIQIAVIFLIFLAGIKMLKKAEKNIFNYIVCGVTAVSVILCSIFAVSFSTIFYIIIFAIVGLMVYLIQRARAKNKEGRL